MTCTWNMNTKSISRQTSRLLTPSVAFLMIHESLDYDLPQNYFWQVASYTNKRNRTHTSHTHNISLSLSLSLSLLLPLLRWLPLSLSLSLSLSSFPRLPAPSPPPPRSILQSNYRKLLGTCLFFILYFVMVRHHKHRALVHHVSPKYRVFLQQSSFAKEPFAKKALSQYRALLQNMLRALAECRLFCKKALFII